MVICRELGEQTLEGQGVLGGLLEQRLPSQRSREKGHKQQLQGGELGGSGVERFWGHGVEHGKIFGVNREI